MRTALLVTALMFITSAAVANDESHTLTKEVEMGMTVHGDTAAAVGLYLMPWSNERASDIDRPPRLLSENFEAVDPVKFKLKSEWHQARRDYKIWRLQRNNW